MPQLVQKQKIQLTKQGIYLVIVRAGNHKSYSKEILTLLKNKKKPGLFITVDKPYNAIAQLLTQNAINLENITVIDLITKTAGGTPEKTGKTLYLNSPSNLTDLSIAIEQVLHKKGNENAYVIFDSLSTMVLYNKEETIQRFFHFLTGKLRYLNTTGIFFVLEKGISTAMLEQFKLFSDDVIQGGNK